MLAVRPFVVWGLCARYTPDAVEADPSERELVVLIRSFYIFADKTLEKANAPSI